MSVPCLGHHGAPRHAAGRDRWVRRSWHDPPEVGRRRALALGHTLSGTAGFERLATDIRATGFGGAYSLALVPARFYALCLTGSPG